MPELTYLRFLYSWLSARLLADERGEITEKVLVTAVFAALALTAGAIIVAKVTERANEIPVR
ncbi:MAG: hypothetical protein AB1679_16605 [Actinomycetota bacterium]|jgi:hypothetical protein